jgi:hypothetical protein
MTNAPQSFGLTISTGNVQGEAIRFQMSDTGTFTPAADPLATMTDAQLEALAASYEAQMNAVMAVSS